MYIYIYIYLAYTLHAFWYNSSRINRNGSWNLWRKSVHLCFSRYAEMKDFLVDKTRTWCLNLELRSMSNRISNWLMFLAKLNNSFISLTFSLTTKKRHKGLLRKTMSAEEQKVIHILNPTQSTNLYDKPKKRLKARKHMIFLPAGWLFKD